MTDTSFTVRLRELCRKDPDELTAEEEQFIRQSAHWLSAALHSIKDELDGRQVPRLAGILRSHAQAALAELPRTEASETFLSKRACGWMAADRLRYLTAIADAEDVVDVARRRVARAFAPMSLRGH